MSMIRHRCFSRCGNSGSAGPGCSPSIPDEPGIEKAEIRWQDKTIPYTRAGKEWITVIGLDLELKPGSYTGDVRITKNGMVERRSVTFNVKAVKFPIQRLEVADEYVELSPENTERALREQKELEGDPQYDLGARPVDGTFHCSHSRRRGRQFWKAEGF